MHRARRVCDMERNISIAGSDPDSIHYLGIDISVQFGILIILDREHVISLWIDELRYLNMLDVEFSVAHAHRHESGNGSLLDSFTH